MRGLETHGNHDNVMLKVLNTGNPRICLAPIKNPMRQGRGRGAVRRWGFDGLIKYPYSGVKTTDLFGREV